MTEQVINTLMEPLSKKLNEINVVLSAKELQLLNSKALSLSEKLINMKEEGVISSLFFLTSSKKLILNSTNKQYLCPHCATCTLCV